MAMVDLDEEVYKEAKEYAEQNKVEYPSIKNLINRVLRDWVAEHKINKESTPELKETAVKSDFWDRFKEEKKEA